MYIAGVREEYFFVGTEITMIIGAAYDLPNFLVFEIDSLCKEFNHLCLKSQEALLP